MADRPTNEYLAFSETVLPGRKTMTVRVYAKRDSALLGTIRWHGPWRQYCFFPSPSTIFNKGCMTTIIEYIDALMEERRA